LFKHRGAQLDMNLISYLVKFLTIGCVAVAVMTATAHADSMNAVETNVVQKTEHDVNHVEMDIKKSFVQLWNETGIKGFVGVTTNFTEHVDATSGETITEAHVNAGWKNLVMGLVGR
jgi:hypothetical protein